MYWKIFILMILCHVIDDFVLQPICLSKLKQKDWWFDNVFKDYNGNYDWRKQEKGKNDYKMALLMHSLSWSAMILLPVIFFMEFSGMWLYWIFIINAFIHYVVDDLKANYNLLNLVQDQCIHLFQIFLTFLIIVIIL